MNERKLRRFCTAMILFAMLTRLLGGVGAGRFAFSEDSAGVETRVCVDKSVTAPVEAGQTLGTLTITSGGQTIAERDLIAPESVGALRWGDVFLQMLRALCMG